MSFARKMARADVPMAGRLVNYTTKRIIRLLCRVDDSHWHKIPSEGPLLLVVNHINFIDVPALYTHLIPRPITGFVKAENWERPLSRWLFELWGAIPLHRGEADLAAMRVGLAALAQGKILAVAPEGTRSGDGCLRPGQPGIIAIALRSNVPILPIACFGHRHFWRNLRRLHRTDFQLAVGRPFYLDGDNLRMTKQVRRQMVDEIMYQLALLLPPGYRGHYADISAATESYLRFLPAWRP